MRRGLLFWRNSVSSYEKSSKRGNSNTSGSTFGLQKDKDQYNKFFKSAVKISEDRWNGILQRCQDHIAQDVAGLKAEENSGDDTNNDSSNISCRNRYVSIISDDV